MTVSASGTRKKTRKTAANGATWSHGGTWPESHRDDESKRDAGVSAGGETPKPLGVRFSLIGIDIPSPRARPRHCSAALTSPRLRGEVGICALVAQIPGEGASPRV